MDAMRRFYNRYRVFHLLPICLFDVVRMVQKSLNPIVLLTKADLITEADLDGRLSDIFDTGVIDVYLNQFCKASTIPRDNVFPIVNFR